jgi:hypothetical protein
MTKDEFCFMRMYPGSNTLEQLAQDINTYFNENPSAIGVEVFVDNKDGTPKPIGFVRNPAMKSIFEDASSIYDKYKRESQERTVEVRIKP